ncbi:MAG TPA: glycosyltransferase family 2 protein [Elusimicrobiota bacterium]|nr:glycosyltransferase family 2 protein [Elusimicrobiota bacterium]
MSTTPHLSIIIPFFNEQECLPDLKETLGRAVIGDSWEILLVDDGSTDRSVSIVERWIEEDPRVRLISFSKNFGQTAAMAAGFENSRGEILVCMDADGQNDPADIPLLLEEMKKGVDVVSGWRRDRKDPFWSRRFPSHLANALISLVTGVSLHDYGCTLKAYRRSMVEGLRLYGDMHRFLPAWCAWQGARVSEIEVHHHPRVKGKSKYGLARTFKVILDLLTAKFFSSYLNKPSYFFGGAGLLLLTIGTLSGLVAVLDRFVWNLWQPYRLPFLMLAVFFGIVGVQFLILGLLAEIIIRIYYENQDKRPYRIARILPEK